ncbi:protein yippee-like [Wolffia australiana]
MGRLHLVALEGEIYSCKHCETQLALAGDIFSRLFQCSRGKAYLFSKVVNIYAGRKEERLMTTGMHTVADIFCVRCGSILGWKYETSHVVNQRYKEGMFILERVKVCGPDGSHCCESEDSFHEEEEDEDEEADDSPNLS